MAGGLRKTKLGRPRHGTDREDSDTNFIDNIFAKTNALCAFCGCLWLVEPVTKPMARLDFARTSAPALVVAARCLGVLAVLALTTFAADPDPNRPASAAPSGSLDSGLNRLREKKSGPAGVPEKHEAAVPPKQVNPVAPVRATPAPVTSVAPETSSSVPDRPAATPSSTRDAPKVAVNRGFQSREILFASAGLVLVFGLWLRWSQENYRSDVEEAIKDNKISADAAGRRMEVRRLLSTLSIVSSLLLFAAALL